jgi:hypothetical protein
MNVIEIQNDISERQGINLDIIKAFTKASIPLEKIEKLKPFFQKYCLNGIYNFFCLI